MKQPFTTAELNEARRMRADGCTYKTIADTLGRSWVTVKYQLDSQFREMRKAANRQRRRTEEGGRRERECRKVWRQENTDLVAAWNKKQRQKGKGTLREKCRTALKGSRRNAKLHGYEPIKATIDDLLIAFDGKCYLCGVPEEECTRRLCADHDHETGEFRGWACSKCNRIIAHIENDRDLIDKFNQLFPKKEEENTTCLS